MNKLHRPTLLGASTLAKQIARNPAKRETWLEDLRREGYSEERIEALLNEQAKFHGVTDLDLLVRGSVWSEGQAEKHLEDQGYDPDIAKTELLIEKLKRIATFERAMASAAVDGYVAGRISEGQLGGFITGTTISPQEKAQYAELASARRICSIQPLTPAEAKAAVHAGVLAPVDYRAALRRDGRDEEAITVLELMLRRELDKEADIARLRQEQAEERAAEKAARAVELAKRKAEIEAARKLARRGSEADLEAAAVRGLIPIARVAEVYAAKYDGDTVAILTDDLTARRADYVAQQKAADDARKRAAVRNIDVGALEQAVLTHVISVGDFRDRLAALKFTAADADLLAATLGARLQAMHDAEVQREKAAAAAQIKHIDLGRFETLVRRGHRTLHDYAALLDSLGFEEGSRAAMGELLQLHIDDDAAAAQLRADVAARSAAKGLTLEQFRRAVIVGAKPISAFTPFLLQNGFTTDAAAVLLAELQFDVDEAVAARARRAEADRRSQAPKAPLSDIRRAARLGLIRVDAYFARLRVDGYTEDEVAIESDLLAAEMARERALVAAAAARDAAAPAEALTLGQIAAAVRVGASTIGAYTARALALGFSTEDAETLTATLQAELDATAAARERRATLIAAGGDRELARADVEKAVRKGVKTLDEYGAWLTAAGYTDDDAALLVAVLQADVDAGAGDDGAP
jgi:SOS response regulatory protein OraA/RecX